ncbi:MAG TPA: SPOR domain-containing protein [Candidimonas sp.]|nr:SPOR domain-containing protein [Candidimonas sp.]
MARTSRKSSSKSGGSTLFGVLIGLIVGLAAAVAVALFVTQTPMPFMDKASRDPAKTLLPDVRDAPDPNIGLYGKDGSAGTAANGPMGTSTTPLPGTPGGAIPAGPDNLGDLIATLQSPEKKSDSAPAPLPPGTEPPAGAPKPAAPAAASTTYYLQAGAYRSANDAEAVKARILLMGMPVQVQKAQVNGGIINRVRVGPFKGIDELNRSRARLGEEKIESSVIRQ